MPNVVDTYDPLRDRYRIAGQWVDVYELHHEMSRWERLIIALTLMAAFPWLWARKDTASA